MTKRHNLMASVCALTLIAGSPAMSEAQSTKILEEYFESIKAAQIVLVVGDKEDNARSTQWNNITLEASNGKIQIAIPWIKVSKKFLGGFEMTYADKVEGAFQSPDPKFLEPIRFVVEHNDMVIEIGGKEGAREYSSSFDEVTVRTLDNNLLNISAKITDGTGSQIIEAGDVGTSSGNFEIKSLMIDYSLDIDGEKVTSSSTMTNFNGKFEIPIYNTYDSENPISSFDPSRNMFIEYSVASGTVHTSMGSPVGPVDLDASFGAGSGAFGLANSVATIAGTTKDISYNLNATGMGMPPMQFLVKDAIVNIAIPLDNVDEVKPTSYKIAINGLTLSDQLWSMFDPKALLPRDAIALDIDVSAGLRWLKKIADIDVKDPGQSPPVEVQSATINAFNLKIAGAELQTSGAVTVDNSQFPPVPDGTVNISLKGGYGLLGKLTELGLVPAQNAMVIQGMTAMFFQPGDAGDDHLVSVITMTKDGHISANGMPLK